VLDTADAGVADAGLLWACTPAGAACLWVRWAGAARLLLLLLLLLAMLLLLLTACIADVPQEVC